MKISVHTGKLVNLFGYENGCKMIREAGFDGVDLNFNDAWDQAEVRSGKLRRCIFEEDMSLVSKYYEPVFSAIEKSGLEIVQAHAPFPPYVAGFPEINGRIPGIYEKCIRLCGEKKIPYLVIHGISREYDGSDMTKEEEIEKNIELYSSMISAISETGVTVLLENIFWDVGGKSYDATCANPDEAAGLIDRLNELAGFEAFGLCFDVGHNNLLLWDMEEYLGKLGGRIKALHVHDNDGRGDWHGFPGSGTVDWRKFCSALLKIGYRGTLNFETFSYYDLRRVSPEMVPILLSNLAAIGRKLAEEIEK